MEKMFSLRIIVDTKSYNEYCKYSFVFDIFIVILPLLEFGLKKSFAKLCGNCMVALTEVVCFRYC